MGRGPRCSASSSDSSDARGYLEPANHSIEPGRARALRLFGPCRGQGEALNVDRHELFQALHSALAAAPLAALEPLRQQPGGEPSAAASDQATADGPTCNGPRGGAAAAGPGSRNGQPGARNGPGGRSGQLRGRLSAADAAPEDLPFEVLLVRTAHQMLVEQVCDSSLVSC